MNKTLGAVGAIVLIVVIFGSLVYFNPSIFNGLMQNSLLITPSQIYVDPQGAVDGNDKPINTYWNLLFNVAGQNVVQGVKLPSGTSGNATIEAISTRLTTGADVEVDITPLQPYLIRDMQQQQVTVAPGAVGNPSPKNQIYFVWNEPSFRIYTPYHIDVLKNGAKIGSADLGGQLNPDGTPVSPQQTIPTSDGDIIIQNLGGLLQTYCAPSMPSIAYFSSNYIYAWDTSTQNMVDGTNPGSVAGTGATKYCDYWYGISRTSANLVTNPTINLNGGITNLYTPSKYGGWEGSDFGGNAQAVTPVVFSADKSVYLPSDKRSFMCLTEWLQSKNVANLIAPGSAVLSKYGSSSVHFVTDSNGQAALKINIPTNAYSTPLVQMRIPVEMADTWVERPQVSDVAVNAFWQSNGQKHLDNIGAQTILVVGLTQQSSVTSSARISVSSSDPRVSVYPIQTTETLASGATKTIYFTVSQSGGSTTDSFTLTINSYEDYTGKLQESDTVTGSFAATVGQDSTMLYIHVQDDSNQSIPVVGLQMQIQFPPTNGQTASEFTDSNGNVAGGISLATTAGGGYVGQVLVKTADTPATSTTPHYNPTSQIVTVHTGENNLIIYLNSSSKPPSFNLTLILEIIGVIVAIATIAGIAYVATKKSRHHRKH